MGKKKSRDFEPINIQARELARKRDEQMRARALQLGGAGKDPRTLGQIKQAEDARRLSAMDRIRLNAPGPKTTASPAPGRGPKKDVLRGLTHEAGTKSLLKGMLKFFK